MMRQIGGDRYRVTARFVLRCNFFGVAVFFALQFFLRCVGSWGFVGNQVLSPDGGTPSQRSRGGVSEVGVGLMDL